MIVKKQIRTIIELDAAETDEFKTTVQNTMRDLHEADWHCPEENIIGQIYDRIMKS